MIRLSINIKNPYAKDVYCKTYEYTKAVSKYKRFEAEHFYCNYNLFGLIIDTSWRGEDHGGPEIEVCFLGVTARYKIYDIRHWDYTKGKWVS